MHKSLPHPTPVRQRGVIDLVVLVVATGTPLVGRVDVPVRIHIVHIGIASMDDLPMPDAVDLRCNPRPRPRSPKSLRERFAPHRALVRRGGIPMVHVEPDQPAGFLRRPRRQFIDMVDQRQREDLGCRCPPQVRPHAEDDRIGIDKRDLRRLPEAAIARRPGEWLDDVVALRRAQASSHPVFSPVIVEVGTHYNTNANTKETGIAKIAKTKIRRNFLRRKRCSCLYAITA